MIVVALALLALAAPRPTPSACANAWNAGATAKQRALVVRTHATEAFIDARVKVFTDTWTKGAGATSTGGPGCEIQFLTAGGRGIDAWAGWGSQRWRMIARAASFPVPANGRVHADGTVGFSG